MYRFFQITAAPVTNAMALTSITSMSVANLSGRGYVPGVGIKVIAAPTGNPSAEIRISVDSGSTVTIPVWAGANTFAVALLGLTPSLGSGLSDFVWIPLHTEYRSSFVLDFYVTSNGSAGNARLTVPYESRVM